MGNNRRVIFGWAFFLCLGAGGGGIAREGRPVQERPAPTPAGKEESVEPEGARGRFAERAEKLVGSAPVD